MQSFMPLHIRLYRMILAGFSIGVAAICFLRGGQILGAILFAFGLSAVVFSKWPLFTGAAGFFDNRKQFMWLWPMLLTNIIGTYLATLITIDMNLADVAAPLVSLRVERGFMGCMLPAIGCGFIMSVSVKYARKGQWLPLVLGIPTFVICGFPHCVADIAYYSIAPAEFSGMLVAWLGTVCGNFIGCNLPILPRDKE